MCIRVYTHGKYEYNYTQINKYREVCICIHIYLDVRVNLHDIPSDYHTLCVSRQLHFAQIIQEGQFSGSEESLQHACMLTLGSLADLGGFRI